MSKFNWRKVSFQTSERRHLLEYEDRLRREVGEELHCYAKTSTPKKRTKKTRDTSRLSAAKQMMEN